MASWMALVTELPGASSTSTGPSAEGVNFVPPVRFLHPETTWKNMEFCPKSRGSLNSFSLWNSDNYGVYSQRFQTQLAKYHPRHSQALFFWEKIHHISVFSGFSIPNFGSIPKGLAAGQRCPQRFPAEGADEQNRCMQLVLMTPRIGREDCVYDMCIWYVCMICTSNLWFYVFV